MGNEQSQLSGPGNNGQPTIDTRNSKGFRIVNVAPGSIGEKYGLESYFDYIVGLNGRILDEGFAAAAAAAASTDNENASDSLGLLKAAITSTLQGSSNPNNNNNNNNNSIALTDELFKQEIFNCQGRSLTFIVWSSKGHSLRQVIIPLDSEAAGESDTILGMSLQWTPLSIADFVWHVLEVQVASPADNANIVPFGDYIIGLANSRWEPEDRLQQQQAEKDRAASNGNEDDDDDDDGLSLLPLLIGENALYRAIESHVDQPLPLLVYNHQLNVTRVVTVIPNRRWGGDGLLGCALAYGYLHRIPQPLNGTIGEVTTGQLKHTVPLPGETMFDGNDVVQENQQDDDDLFTPATGPPPLGAPPQQQQQQHHHHSRHHRNTISKSKPGAPSDIQEYFAEQEKQSKERDVISKTNESNLPPPPTTTTSSSSTNKDELKTTI